MTNKIVNLNDHNFEENILREERILLVDFWAKWCNPCKILSVFLEEIVDEFDNKVVISKINIDENPITTQKYAIRSIPTLLLFHSGNIKDTKIGSLSKNQLRDFINANT